MIIILVIITNKYLLCLCLCIEKNILLFIEIMTCQNSNGVIKYKSKYKFYYKGKYITSIRLIMEN